MAKKIITTTVVTDDFDGNEIQDGLAEEITFGFEGKTYRIDLRPQNAEKIRKDMQKWVAAAQEVGALRLEEGKRRGRPAGSKNTSTRPDTSSGRSKEELANIREWAQANGHEVAPRGRIASPVLEAYDEAHKSGAMS